MCVYVYDVHVIFILFVCFLLIFQSQFFSCFHFFLFASTLSEKKDFFYTVSCIMIFHVELLSHSHMECWACVKFPRDTTKLYMMREYFFTSWQKIAEKFLWNFISYLHSSIPHVVHPNGRIMMCIWRHMFSHHCTHPMN